HGELIGGISRKVLTQTLRRLEAHGILRRHAYAEVPPRVEYELTPLGETLIDPIHTLNEWARANGDAVLDALADAPGRAVAGDRGLTGGTGSWPPARRGRRWRGSPERRCR